MRYRPNPVNQSPTPRRRRARRLPAALGLLAFTLVALLGSVLGFARAAAGTPVVAAHVVAHAGGGPRATMHSKCGKARAVVHAKHLRPHVKSAALDDDDDDDDDGGIDAFAAAYDQAIVLPAVPGAVAVAPVLVRLPVPRGHAVEPHTQARSTRRARGPPVGRVRSL
jgi:hypothetical protein